MIYRQLPPDRHLSSTMKHCIMEFGLEIYQACCKNLSSVQ